MPISLKCQNYGLYPHGKKILKHHSNNLYIAKYQQY
jgi:hypothetical protein